MRVLVLNGSPKGEGSNTLQLTKAFLAGIERAAPAQVEILPVYNLRLQPCRGCFACWSATPGACSIRDDMAGVMEKLLAADVVIWSFPLYYFGLPSGLKALMDRQLPMSLPFMADGAVGGGHPSRYDMTGKRYVLISTCGFYTAEGNYDAINAQFDRLWGRGNYTRLYCGQGELFRVPELRARTGGYLRLVSEAGEEFARGGVREDTLRALAEPLYPRAQFEAMADASWEIMAGERAGEESRDASLPFTRQMAALYNPASWQGKDRVVEMVYTDCGKRYQMVLTAKGSQVLERDFLPYTTRIETPLTVWQDIARGAIGGAEAMMQRKYRVEGDFDLMLRWSEIFGPGTEKEGQGQEPQAAPRPSRTMMPLLLAPWMALWIVLPMDAVAGGALGAAVCALLPAAYLRYRMTPFETLTLAAVGGISLAALLGCPGAPLVLLSYALFGLMWLTTTFLPLPLTAYYSCEAYGGRAMLDNPLFVRTNRILTACWGVLYLVTPLWSAGLLSSPLANLTGAVNSLCPALMGAFTAWFQRWYPARYARRAARGREK